MTTLTLKDVSDILGVSVRTVQRWKPDLDIAGIRSSQGGGRGNETEFRWPSDIVSIQVTSTRMFIMYDNGTIRSVQRNPVRRSIANAVVQAEDN